MLLSAFAGLAFASGALADSIVLKSGEKIEGKILSETPTELTVEIVSGGVVDERKLNKADVDTVSKMSPDELAWQQLQGLKLGDDSLQSPEQYDAYISPLKSFAAQFSSSTHKAEAEKLAEEFEAEKKRVAGGELKLKGLWLSKEQVQRERYQVSGQIAANYMAAQAGRNDLVGAMNTFELIEQQFPGSRGYIEASELAVRITAGLKQATAQRLAALPKENADRERGVKAAAGFEQIQLKKELETEKKQNEAALQDAKKRGLKWPPFLRRSEDSMKQIAKLADDTEKRLASFDRAKARKSLDLAEQARADMENKDFASAEAKLKEAQPLWAKNEMLARVSKELADAREAAKAEAETAPAATPAPAKDAAKTTPAPASAPTGTGAAKTATTTSSEQPAGTSVTEEEQPVNWLLVIVGSVLLAILASVGWYAYMRVRKKANEIIA